MATATTAVTESTASAELTTSPMRSRCPRPSASAMNRVTPACRPRSEMLRYPAETENASASVRIPYGSLPRWWPASPITKKLAKQREHTDSTGDQRVAEDAAPVRDGSGRDRHAERDSPDRGSSRAASRCIAHTAGRAVAATPLAPPDRARTPRRPRRGRAAVSRGAPRADARSGRGPRGRRRSGASTRDHDRCGPRARPVVVEVLADSHGDMLALVRQRRLPVDAHETFGGQHLDVVAVRDTSRGATLLA